MVVLLTFCWDGQCGFSTVRVGVILRNGCGIQGQNYVAVLQDSRVSLQQLGCMYIML